MMEYTLDRLIELIADVQMPGTVRLDATRALQERLDLDDPQTLCDIESYHGWAAANRVAAWNRTLSEPLPF